MADLHHQALSITAVFVALAVGVAAGAAAVGGRLGSQGELVAQLERQFSALQAQLATAAARERQAQATLRLYEQALNRLIPVVTSGHMAGLPVRIEASPGAQKPAAALAALLAESGARVQSVEVPAQAAPAFVLVRTPCSAVAGFVGPPLPGGEGRLPPSLATATAPAGAWVWQVESALGRLSLLISIIEGQKGYVSARRVVEHLGELASRRPGERRGACL
ncbi:MAG: copper transporter [Bacillota bacterium]